MVAHETDEIVNAARAWAAEHADEIRLASTEWLAEKQQQFYMMYDEPAPSNPGDMSELSLCEVFDFFPEEPIAGLRLTQGVTIKHPEHETPVTNHRCFSGLGVVLDFTAGQAAPGIDRTQPKGAGIAYLLEHAPHLVTDHGNGLLSLCGKIDEIRNVLGFEYVLPSVNE